MTDVRYPTLLLDLDHTLLDSDASEALAFDAALRAVGVDDPQRHLPAYLEINRALWVEVERGTTTPSTVRVERFVRLVASGGIDADPHDLADAFVAGLAAHGDLYPGVRDVLDALTGRVAMGLVTNGLGEVQRARLDRLGLGRYFDAVVISSEVGCAKPAGEIFARALEELGVSAPRDVLMVGDSLSSDVRGGRAFGIATCWYNPHRLGRGADDRSDHEIHAFGELAAIVSGT
jgi:YjjG family noncanonical pyrimidine nucleotidase